MLTNDIGVEDPVELPERPAPAPTSWDDDEDEDGLA